ncbi:MAG TPA: hypothetical protein DCM86_16150 [Verrucomicrobiales bacterium]|nr:hypothetical protein [Verrucomicrobiales bacterium]
MNSNSSPVPPSPRFPLAAWVVIGVLVMSFAALAVEPATSGGDHVPKGIFQWRPFLAPFHAVVLHYPIGFLTMAFLLELYRWKRPSPEVTRITTWIIVLSLLTGLIAATLGIMRAANGGYEGRNLDLHRWYGIAIPFLTLLTLGLQLRSCSGVRRPISLAGYRLGLVVTLFALVLGGHYGGNLTHGSKYLVQNAPQFLKTLLEEEAPAAPPAGTNGTPAKADLDDPGVKLFVDKVKPVFESKCLQCHGAEKQKGKYRMDTREMAFKAGESGKEPITAKEPMKSNLVRLILLPEDSDDVMPPSGKGQLKPEEVGEILRWIQLGAPWPEGLPAAAPAKAAGSAATH